MGRTIKSMEDKYLQKSLDLVEQVFTEYDCAREGKMVRALVEEIRNKRFYLPELELMMVDGQQRLRNPRINQNRQ